MSTSILASRADRRVAVALFALLACLPFLGYVRAQPMPNFWGEWVAAVLALAALAIVGLPRGQFRAAAPLLAVAAVLLLQLAARLVPMPVATLVAAALLLLAGLLAARAAGGDGEAIGEGLAVGFIAALAFNAVAVAFERAGYEWQLIHLYRIEPPPRAVGLVGQSNHLATLAVLGMLAAGALRQAGRMPRMGLWLVAVAAAFVLAASSSRAGLVVAAVALLVPLAGRRADGSALSRREWIALVAVFAAIQVAWIVAPTTPTASTGAAGNLLIARSDAGRSFIWRDALGIAAAHPLLGVGHGNFAAARLHEMTGPMAAPNVNHAHNLFLQVASEWGLVGLVVVLAAVAWWARAGLRTLRAPQPGPMRLFALGVMLALFVHSLAEHPLWFTYFLMPFALCAGILTGSQEARETPPRSGLAIGVGLAVAAAIGAVAALDYQRLHRIAAGLRADAFREPGTPPAVQLADVVAAERLTLFPRPATLLLSTVLPINPTAAEAKLVVTRRAMDMIPAGQTLTRWAAFAVLTGRQDDARRLLLAMRERHPPSYAEARELLQRSTFGQQVLVDFADALPPP